MRTALKLLKRPSRRSPGSRAKSVPTCQGLRPCRVEQALAFTRTSIANITESQSVRAQTNQNPRGIDLLFFPSLLEFEPSTFWRSFKEPVKVDPKNGLNPFLFRPIQYISTLTGRFELPRGGWSGDAILAQIANVCDLIQSRKLSGICFGFISEIHSIVDATNLASLQFRRFSLSS